VEVLETAGTAAGVEDLMWHGQRDAFMALPSNHMLNKLFRARELSDGQTRVSIECISE
jgi:hypothetical protein